MSYFAYVFLSYAITVVVLAGLVATSLRSYLRLRQAEIDRRAGDGK